MKPSHPATGHPDGRGQGTAASFRTHPPEPRHRNHPSKAGNAALPGSARSRHQHGFSLLEVIAAILLLAITFTALMKVAGASLRLTQNAADYSEAAMWARGQLDGAFVGEPLRPGRSDGQFNRKFRWQLSVTPWNGAGVPPANAPLHLYQLDLEVLWGPPAHPRSAHFRTLRLSGQNIELPQAAP